MIATKTLPAVRTANTPTLRVQLDPHWDKARELLAKGRRVAQEFAVELERLRDQYLGEGHGGDRRSKNQVSHDETLDREAGFQAAVERELNISKATAYRYLAAVEALSICQQIEAAPEGEVIELKEGSYEITDEVRAKAKVLREEIVTGGVPMNRALPAVQGMFGVRGGGTGGKAATNHAANTWTALVKARNSINARYWRQGKLPNGLSWDAATAEWTALLHQLPDELRAATVAWVKQGMPRTEA